MLRFRTDQEVLTDGGSSPDCKPRRPDVGVKLSFGVIPESGVLPLVDEEQAGSVDAFKKSWEERAADRVGGNSGGKGCREEAGMGVAMGCGR